MIDWKNISLGNLAGFISEELKKQDIHVILVGGACVTIYSHNRYQSYDLDFVTFENMKQVKLALNELGFFEKNGCFQHEHCKWFIEFVPPPVAIGNESVINFQETRVATGIIKMLRIEDSVKDRLASYFHWGDRQGLSQAIDICVECKVDYKEIEAWSLKEGFNDKFQEFIHKLKK